ncbi:MAG: methyl-accepting chemotaxis protein [Chromatiales bacterium]|nr:methyl-accepting chemotaxis protein [Chromatiales bacterium]
MFKMILDLRIGTRYALTFLMLLAMMTSIIITWSSIEQEKMAIKQATDFSAGIHQMTLASLTGMMMTGTISQRNLYLEQVREANDINELRVIRGPNVNKVYGPGLADEKPYDSIEKQVIQTGKSHTEIISKNGSPSELRVIKPIIASKNYLGKNCLTCHAVKEGELLGAVAIRISLEEMSTEVSSFRTTITIVTVILSLIVLGVSLWGTQRFVTTPLSKIVEAIQRIASGDLTVEVTKHSEDEIGMAAAALIEMRDNLHSLVTEINQAGVDVDLASSEIAQGNNNLSERTEQQGIELSRINENTNDLTASVKESANLANRAVETTTDAGKKAIGGNQVVKQATVAMEEIAESSKNITNIVSVIDDIAFQTNLLALNAAVEAARAGDQGRGFAVVAQEVRMLALKSAESAAHIKQLVNDSAQKVKQGHQMVDKSGLVFDEIVAAVEQVERTNREIADASQSQSSSLHEVSQALNIMDDNTQQNSALVEEAAAASESLSEQAGKLRDQVKAFKLES